MSATPFPNQPPDYEGRNLFRGDAPLAEALRREGAAGDDAAVDAFGAAMGSADLHAAAAAANRHPPLLHTHDRRGERIDAIEFHPAWHALMERATATGLHVEPWLDPRPGAQVARAARYYLYSQVENGSQCPLTMTFAAVPLLRRVGAFAPQVVADWLPRVLVRDYDPRALPASAKRALLLGMGMTERQGGSDVRSNLTRADDAGAGCVRITGHKWFFSAPQCDGHLVLAQATGGLTCYLLPRMLPDGQRNAVRVVRLKDKLGNRSNASAEVEFDGALAWPVGPEGRGVATILEMVQHTRLDCVVASAGMMRGALAYALHHARHRVAFGARLADQPLMARVLADLALEVEAATALALSVARRFEADADAGQRALARVLVPAAKYWVCKRAPMVALETMEVLGGNGYVEDAPLARLYREAPVNSIWEGSGNVICLDVLRALAREPTAADALRQALAAARGGHPAYDAHLAALLRDLAAPAREEADARRIAQAIATAAAAALLIRGAPAHVADAYCASRLAPSAHAGAAFGTLPASVAAAPLLARVDGG